MSSSLNSLTKHPLIFRGREQPAAEHQGRRIAFGHKKLDQACVGGAPAAGLIRLRVLPGCGEMSLITPLISDKAASKKRILWLQRGALAFNTNWLSQQAFGQQSWVIHCGNDTDTLWVCEQALRSQACTCLIMYFDQLSIKAARRLQVLARQYDCLVIVFSRPGTTSLTLPVSLDFELRYRQSAWHINIYRVTGAWPLDNIVINNPLPMTNQAIAEAFAKYADDADTALHQVG
ncbi:hypothetical protein [Alteromonas gilva]|uniref:RecA/RadA recombinase n=1 Tax=Alteromonas gilva TaxID=2987522 RepID=A0ABT5L455_9ALTE|nr:hypothetical protein [Alteromonas gilva]MDC8831822.1 hypothetical protein [Alteromonas gilva]